MLEGTLGQVLTLRDRLRTDVTLDQNAAHATLAELDRKTETDRPAPDNDDLCGRLGWCDSSRLLVIGGECRADGRNEVRADLKSSIISQYKILPQDFPCWSAEICAATRRTSAPI